MEIFLNSNNIGAEKNQRSIENQVNEETQTLYSTPSLLFTYFQDH